MKRNIRKEVRRLIDKYETRNPIELIELLDISLVKTTLGGRMRGYYCCPLDIESICISSNLSDEDTNMVAAHELAHALFHRNMNVLFISSNTFCNKGRYEKLANYFSADLLLPDDIFKNHKGECFEFIAKAEGVSYELVKLKSELISVNI